MTFILTWHVFYRNFHVKIIEHLQQYKLLKIQISLIGLTYLHICSRHQSSDFRVTHAAKDMLLEAPLLQFQTRHLVSVSVLLFGSCHLILVLFVSSTNSIQIARRQCCLCNSSINYLANKYLDYKVLPTLSKAAATFSNYAVKVY